MSSVNATINELNQATSLIVLILSIISVGIGGIGLIFNVFIFTRPSLRREPCAVYFFGSTCISLITVFVIQPMRVFAVSFNMDISNYNLGICKTQLFTLYVTRIVSTWLIVLACIDRFFHSSANARLRRMSSFKIARVDTIIISIILFIGHIHMIIYFEINPGRDRFGNLTPLCNPQKGVYATFLPFWNIVLYSLFPSFMMLLFGLLTLKNLRQLRGVVPVANDINRVVRRTDTQLLRMLTAQVLVIIICTLPVSIFQLYASFTSGIVKDTLRIAQENVASRTVGIIPYFAHSSTFYLYTLTGTVFRKEFVKIIRRCWQLKRNIIVPTSGQMNQLTVLQKGQPMIVMHGAPVQDNNNTIQTTNT